MGYRSQVVFAVAPEAASAFMALQAKYPDVLKLCSEADDFSSGYEQEGDWFMHWSSIKWYEGYEDVGPLIRFIEALDSDDLSEFGEPAAPKDEHGNPGDWHEHFRFVRIGDDYDDIEDKGWAFDGIGINRQVHF